MAKVAIIVLEGTELKKSVAKIRHAMIYSKEIKASGNEIIPKSFNLSSAIVVLCLEAPVRFEISLWVNLNLIFI